MLDKAIRFLELPLDKEGGIKWRLNDRPEKARSNRQGLFVPYVSIEVVLHRLNRALKEGYIEDWTATYQILPSLESKESSDGTSSPVYVSCALRIKIAGEWHERTDVGSGNDYKDAYSDALKRAARLFGVGAYVAHMEPRYVPVDDRLRPTSEAEFRKEEERIIRRLFPDYRPEHRAEHVAATTVHRTEKNADPDVILTRLRNAHRAINDLVSDLKNRGLGVEVARLFLQHRWHQDEIPENPTSADLDKAINLYRALEAIGKDKVKDKAKDKVKEESLKS
jgi:hypothetical protein